MSAVAAFTRTYDEAMGLLVEARNYVAVEARNRPAGTAEAGLILCCETMRVTARLTHVMAWLLAQRAVQAGELTAEEAVREPFALGGRTTCLVHFSGVESVADRRLLGLLDRSEALYVRVARLDERARMLAEDAAPARPRRGAYLRPVGD